MKVGDKVRWGNGLWTVEGLAEDGSATITQAQRDWSGEEAVAVLKVGAEQVASPLPEVFHTLFDLKDASDAGSAAFVAAYEALRKVEDLMRIQGVPIPRRFDKEA